MSVERAAADAKPALSAADLERLDMAAGATFMPSSYDPAAHTVDLVMTTGQRVSRWYGFLELATTPDAVDLSRVAAGKVHLIDSHNTDSIQSILGNILSVRFDGGFPVAKARFAATPLGQLAEAMVARGELTGASPGIHILEREKIGMQDDAPVYRATRWMPHEMSLTSVPADGAAGALSLSHAAPPGSERTQKVTINENAEIDNPAGRRIAADAVANERHRNKIIRDRVKAAGLPVEEADKPIDSGIAIEHVAGRLVDVFASYGTQHVSPRIIVDHTDPAAIRERMSDALALRGMTSIPTELRDKTIAPAQQAAAREFMAAGFLEMFADLGRHRGEKIPRGLSKAQLYDRCSEQMSLSTSDFPLLLASSANKILLPAYTLSGPTYKKFFALKTFNDFKAHNFLRIGDFPDLLVKGETGELKYGSVSESRQQITAAEYGRILRISRRIIINDDVAAFADIPSMAGRRAAVFENTLAYRQFDLNTKAGPNITEAGAATALWETTTHKNLAASGTAIGVASLGIGAAAIQNQQTMDGGFPNIAPKFLVTCPAQRAVAFQYCSAAYQPTLQSSISPFAGILEPVFDANLTANSTTSWYMFADPGMCPTFIYGYLAGQEGPRFAVQQGFETEGLDLKLALDFGVGAVDFRGTYKNPGA